MLNRTNIGRVFFPSVQCVAAFATSYPHIWGDLPSSPRQKRTAAIPCLIPCAIDQDPYFRLLRDNAHRMRQPSPKPALIHSKFLTALQGAGGKMSASDPTSAIFMADTKAEVKKKINKYAFSGGGATMEEHREHGGNPDVDVPFQYLTYFLDDDNELERIRRSYKSGELLTGEMKQLCIGVMQAYVEDFQARRKMVTDEVLRQAMTPRRLEWRGNPNPVKKAAAPAGGKSGATQTAATQPRVQAAPLEQLLPPLNIASSSSEQTQPSSLPRQEQHQQRHDVSRPAPQPFPGSLPPQTAVPAVTQTSSATQDAARKPQRPALDVLGRTSSYGVRGLSGYGDGLVSQLYPAGRGRNGFLNEVEE